MRLLVCLCVLGAAAIAIGVCCHVSLFKLALGAGGLAITEMLIPAPGTGSRRSS